jgi:hypothetical protein
LYRAAHIDGFDRGRHPEGQFVFRSVVFLRGRAAIPATAWAVANLLGALMDARASRRVSANLEQLAMRYTLTIWTTPARPALAAAALAPAVGLRLGVGGIEVEGGGEGGEDG